MMRVLDTAGPMSAARNPNSGLHKAVCRVQIRLSDQLHMPALPSIQKYDNVEQALQSPELGVVTRTGFITAG